MFGQSGTQSTVYFKRFKMEIDLVAPPPPARLPVGFTWTPWDDGLLDLHADVLFRSFHAEIDAQVFPSLGDRVGCRQLMNEVRHKKGFVPGATWLVACADGYCGTVQGLSERTGLGAIQNLGVLPRYRGRGLGSALLLQALAGFRRAGLGLGFLEVTARNDAAVRLYRRLGFRRKKILYKAVEALATLAPACQQKEWIPCPNSFTSISSPTD